MFYERIMLVTILVSCDLGSLFDRNNVQGVSLSKMGCKRVQFMVAGLANSREVFRTSAWLPSKSPYSIEQ